MKVFISADIEGVTGVVHSDQTGGSSGDYMRARRWMTGDVNAAIEGALKAGASEIYVKDSHGNGRNILLEEMRKEAHLISGWDTMLSMVQGIDKTFDALILIGYHSMAGTKNGVLAHTFTSCVKQLSVNDQPIGEPEISALVAGHYGVPVTFIAGDQTAVGELIGFIGEIPHAITKYGMGRETARTIHPELTQQAIIDGVSDALSDLTRFKPFKISPPLRMSLKLTSSKMVDLIDLLPNVERLSIDEVSYQAEDAIQIFKMFRVMLGLAWSDRL